MWLIQQFYVFNVLAEDITSDYGFLLQLVSTLTIDTDKYYQMCYKVNGCQDLKNILFYALC